MKVRISEIPEKSGKPQYPDRDKKTVSGNFDGGEDKNLYLALENDDEDEGEAGNEYFKKMIQLPDFGILISLSGIESIEKDTRFIDKPKAHWEYGIIINKGISSSKFIPKTDIEVWFYKEEVRDQRWESIIETLRKNSTNVIDV